MLDFLVNARIPRPLLFFSTTFNARLSKDQEQLYWNSFYPKFQPFHLPLVLLIYAAHVLLILNAFISSSNLEFDSIKDPYRSLLTQPESLKAKSICIKFMAASTLQFTTLDVFTSARYKGNPLAIVQVPETVSLSQEQKQSIAAEFNLSETVFLHTPGTSANNSDEPIQIDIFTTSAELPFAGHPTVGTSHFLLEKLDKDQIILKTKAGLIPAVRGASGGARLSAPLDFAIHPNLAFPNIRAMFPDVDFVQESQDPVVSPVKGLCFLLVEVASEAALAKLRTFSEKELVLPDGHAGEWQGFFALYAFYVSGEGKLRTRMFFDGIEDPATGAAAITLGGYLGATRGMTDLEIIQGVEMGRKSEILVKVSLGEKGNNGTFQVKKVELEGSAVQVMSGELVPPM